MRAVESESLRRGARGASTPCEDAACTVTTIAYVNEKPKTRLAPRERLKWSERFFTSFVHTYRADDAAPR